MEEVLSSSKGKQIAEYNYNYWYQGTTVRHNIKEYYYQERGIRTAVLEKETRKGDFFVKLPHSLWITKDGYPPLVTDGALKNHPRNRTSYFAALPTVQSQDHIKKFDDSLNKGLKEMGLDYNQLSRELKEGKLINNFPITGFLYRKKDILDSEMLKEFEKRALKAYEKVLESKPQRCPVELFIKEILGPRTVAECSLFKKEGFDVPLSAQRAFFTMMMDYREEDEQEPLKNEE